MASGDDVLKILEIMPPGTLAAIPTVLVGGSTPAEGVMVWEFPDAAITYLDLKCQLRGYGHSGLTMRVAHSSSVAANEARIEVAIRRMQDDAEDLDSAHTYDYNAVDMTAPSAINEVVYDTISFGDGADMDSWDDEEIAIVRLRRNGTHANDDMAGIWRLWSLSAKEA